MRKLNLGDAFKVARIVKEAGVKDELSKLAGKFKNIENANIDEVGFEVLLTLISAASSDKVEAQIYELIGSIKGIAPQEVKNLDFVELKEFVKGVIAENDLKNFFKSASKLM